MRAFVVVLRRHNKEASRGEHVGRVDRMREPDLPAPSLPGGGGGGKRAHNLLVVDPEMPLKFLRKFANFFSKLLFSVG